MKLKPRDRSEVYDRLYRLAHRILNKNKCCANCPIRSVLDNSRSWCCNGCPHLGPNGCTVKALGCSLWLCGNANSKADKAGKRLKKLARIADHYKIYLARASKEQSLRLGETAGFWDIYARRAV